MGAGRPEESLDQFSGKLFQTYCNIRFRRNSEKIYVSYKL